MKAVNLLPTDLRRGGRKPRPEGPRDKLREFGPFVVLGVLSITLVAAVGNVWLGNSVKDKRAKLALVSSKYDQLASRIDALKPYADLEQTVTERRQLVSKLARSRFDWDQSLRDLSRQIPEGITLATINGSIASGGASGGNAMRAAIASPAIELTGCGKSQTLIADMLSDLGNVDGVTRVTLSKSDKETVTSSPGASASGDGPCGKGAPSFEAVVFFEKVVIPPEFTSAGVPAGAAPAEGSSGSSSSSSPSSSSGSTAPGGDSKASAGGTK